MLIAAYSGSKFIAVLKGKIPEMFGRYMKSLEAMQTRFTDFYIRTVQEGYCKQLATDLLTEQFKQTLPVIIGSDYLRRHDITLPEVLKEYYRLLLSQLQCADYADAVNRDGNYAFMNNLTQILEGDFPAD